MAYQFSGDVNTIALYHLEDVNDSSGNGRTLTNGGSVGFVAGLFANCADLGTANSSKVLYRDVLGLTVNAQRTVITWIKVRTELTGADTYWYLSSFGYSTEKVNWGLSYQRVSSINSIIATRIRQGTAQETVIYGVTLGTTNWHMLAYTVGATNLSLYLDGQPVGTPIAFNTGNGSTAATDGFTLGALTGGSYYSSIYQDESFVENVCWSDNQIKSYYNGFSGTPVATAPFFMI
jgi:hypothetical protein